MKTSQYFADLRTSYAAEIDDHSTDSEGKDVLRAQLKKKRAQFTELLPMIGFAPEMVALAFHGGISFPYPQHLEALVRGEPDDFPEWGELAQWLDLSDWAADLAQRALQEEGGEQFMILTAALEFLHERSGAAASAESAAAQARIGDEEREPVEDSDEGESDDGDSEQAGNDWMAEQGFDRLD